jgi:hypothetical protein
MPTNLDLLADSFNKYIVSPLNAFGLGGFVFDLEGETTATLSTEITDHFLEDNVAVQDHIAIRPKKIILKSYVGELIYRLDDTTDTIVQKVTRKLTSLSLLLPTLSPGAEQLVDFIKQGKLNDLSLESVSLESINKTTDYWAVAKNFATGGSRQQQAYMYFKALMEKKLLVSVQTPFEFFPNMAIESITAIQSEDTRFMSDFTITLKQIRTVKIANAQFDLALSKSPDVPQTGAPSPKAYQGRSLVQFGPLNQVGNMPGTPATFAGVLQEMKNMGMEPLDESLLGEVFP